MCAPVIAMTALSVASAIAAQNQASSTADAQARAAREAEAADLSTLDLQAKQIGDKAVRETVAIRRQALKERGTLVAAQSEAGFIGNSPFRERYVSQQKEDEAIVGTNANAENALLQNSTEKYKVGSVARSRVNEAYSRIPSGLVAGLQIATAGVSGATQGYNLTKILRGA